MLTTADYRKAARNAEHACDWQTAANFWLLALQLYPDSQRGQLAEADKDKIKRRYLACSQMAKVPA